MPSALFLAPSDLTHYVPGGRRVRCVRRGPATTARPSDPAARTAELTEKARRAARTPVQPHEIAPPDAARATAGSGDDDAPRIMVQTSHQCRYIARD
ncbi:MAG: hypothetical protein J2P19_11760, partial [Pseudonocardia sp.]|nr:hypothetical protein [Pseudonocardia sp.]